MSPRQFFVGRTVVLAILIVVLGLGALAMLTWQWYGNKNATFPPHENVCYQMAIESLSSLRSRDGITVPGFPQKGVTHMRCMAQRGLLQYEIAGTDDAGADFHIYYLSQGTAASGADMVSDYCYMRGGEVASGMRVIGREATLSKPYCRFDSTLGAESGVAYDFGPAVQR